MKRTTKRVQLTEEGALLYEKWQNILSDLQNGYEEAKHLSESRSSTLNIGVTNTTDPDTYFWAIASRFQQSSPEISINVEYEDMKYLENGLLENRYDLIFVPDFEHYTLDVCHIPWKYAARANMQIIMLNSHPLCQKSELTMEDILEERLVALSPKTNPNFLRSIQELFGAYGREPQICRFYKSNFQIRYAAAMQDAIHITDDFWAYSSNEYSRKISLKDHYNGIICAWSASSSKACLGEFLGVI